MNGYQAGRTGFRKALIFFIPVLLLLAAGCGGAKKIKSYEVEIRVLPMAAGRRPLRVRLVLSAADALKNPNLSQTDEYILHEKTPLTATLLKAAAVRMRAAGIEPLEEKEAAVSSGRLVVVLTRLESKLLKRSWLSSAAIRAERYGKGGRLIGKWEAIGRGAHPDSRLFAAGAGLAMGKALSQALNKLPWGQIASDRPNIPPAPSQSRQPRSQ